MMTGDLSLCICVGFMPCLTWAGEGLGAFTV